MQFLRLCSAHILDVQFVAQPLDRRFDLRGCHGECERGGKTEDTWVRVGFVEARGQFVIRMLRP